MKRLKNNYPVLHNTIETFCILTIGLWFNIILVSQIFFVFKRPISVLSLVIGALLTLIFTLLYVFEKFKNNFFVPLICAIMLFVITAIPLTIITSNIYDTSYDGQAYHQEAIIQFDHGWNPVYMDLTQEATANLERWINHYPKATWLLAANIYKLTGNIESGKIYSLYAPILSFAFVMWGLWNVAISWKAKLLSALAFSLNPIIIYQSLSFYLDGILVSLLLALLAVCFKISQKKDAYLSYLFVMIFVILVNVKLSSLVYAVLLMGAVVSYLWFADRLKLSLSMAKYTLIGLILGVIFIGYNPYVKNFAGYGHILHPAMGKYALDYEPLNMPENYYNLPTPIRFFASIFSESSLARGEGQYAKLKLPFMVYERELETFYETNAKVGGFGPFFALIFLISILAIAIRPKVVSVYFGVALVGSSFLLSTSSVARFVPFVWWISGFLMIVYSKNKILLFGMSFLVLINAVLISLYYFPYNISQSNTMKSELQELAQTNETLNISVRQFGSTKLKLDEYGIKYKEVFYDDTECKLFLTRSIARICE